MGKTSEVSLEERQKIVLWYTKGLKQTEIAKKINRGQNTISRILKKYRETGTWSSAPRTGRPKIIDKPRDSRILKNIIRKDRHLSVRQIAEQLSFLTKTPVSHSTAHRRMKEIGMKSCAARKKPLLSPLQKKKRLQWAQKYMNWSPIQWTKVLFSDESMFCLDLNKGKKIWRTLEEVNHPSCTNCQVKHPVKVMVWGCFGNEGVGELCIITSKVNTEAYLEIMDTYLIPSVESLFPDDDFIYQQDGAPAHKSRAALKYFAENDIYLLEWPGNSPDMNPIENLWAIIKRKVQKLCPKTKSELISSIREIWNDITPELCRNLISSMPARLKDVIKAKGDVTKW